MLDAYTSRPARHAKGRFGAGMVCVVCTADASGFATRAHRLATAKGIGGRFSHREGGYIMSQPAFAKFERLYAQGWDASITRGLYNPQAKD